MHIPPIPVILFAFVAYVHCASFPINGAKEEVSVSKTVPIVTSFVPLNKLRLDHTITKRSAIDIGSSSKRRRRRRKEEPTADEGLLKAKKIKAEQLKTESLKARKIQADRIRSDAIISDTVIVTSKRRRPKERPIPRSFDEPVPVRRPPPSGDYKIIDFTKGTVNVDVRLPELSGIFEEGDRSRSSRRRQRERQDNIDSFRDVQKQVELLDRLQTIGRRPDFDDIQGFRPDRQRSSRPKTINDFQFEIDQTMVPDAKSFSYNNAPSDSGMGVLDARDISANTIKARSMNADRITADKIMSQNVKTRTLQIDNNPFAEMSLFSHTSQSNGNDKKAKIKKRKFSSNHPSVISKEMGPNYDVTKKQEEPIPNFQLLGISKASKPELQMYIEPPVWKQPIKTKVDKYFYNEPQVKIFLNSAARDRFRPKYSVDAPMGEYVSDNYNMGQKSVNSFFDLHFI